MEAFLLKLASLWFKIDPSTLHFLRLSKSQKLIPQLDEICIFLNQKQSDWGLFS
jgi:hypothetical protein